MNDEVDCEFIYNTIIAQVHYMKPMNYLKIGE